MPAVAGLSDGRFVAVWRDPGAGGLGTLKYAIFNADGTVAKSEAIANQNITGVIDAGDVAVAALTGGGFRNYVELAAEQSERHFPPRLQQFGRPRHRGSDKQL